MAHFSPWTALLGGALIGAAASLFLASTGRVAGISGIVAGILDATPAAHAWRWWFSIGLVVVGATATLLFPNLVANDLGRPLAITGLGGLLVGVGARVGGGCTSGHGVCGVSRLSARSIVATGAFILTGVATSILARLALGGR